MRCASPSGANFGEFTFTLSLLGVERDITRKGGRADERASPTGKAQEYPTVGTRALLQQRDYVGGPRLLRRGVNLLRAQGQGQRHSALHLRDARGPEDSRGSRVSKLAGVERAQLRRIHLPRTPVNKCTKRCQEDRSGNVDGYHTGAMDRFGVSLSRGRPSRNAWPLAAKAKSWLSCRSCHTSKRPLAWEGSSWTTGHSR